MLFCVCEFYVFVCCTRPTTDSRGHGSNEETAPGNGAGAGGELSDHSTREPGEEACMRVCV